MLLGDTPCHWSDPVQGLGHGHWDAASILQGKVLCGVTPELSFFIGAKGVWVINCSSAYRAATKTM